MTLIELEKVTKSYRNTGLRPRDNRGLAPALQETDLLISAGQSLGILGRSGAGKTTLGKLICGLEPPTSGKVIIKGQIARAPGDSGGQSAVRGITLAVTVQMIWQDTPGSLNPRMRIADIIAEPLRIHGLQGKDKGRATVARLLEEVSLPSGLWRRYPHELSGGEVQRVAIARALALDPKVLVCDEPASALDVITKMQIADLLARLHRERGMTLLLIAHDMPLIRKLTDWLLVMQAGAIVEEGPTRQLLSAPQHACTREIVAAEPVWLERHMETSAASKKAVFNDRSTPENEKPVA